MSPEEVSTNSPWVAAILGSLGVVGTVVSTLVHTTVKRGLAQAEENAKLKQAAMLASIDKARSEMLLKLESLRGDFRVLQAEVKSALISAEKTQAEQSKRTEMALTAVKNVIQKGEARFEFLQKELHQVRVFCQRIVTKEDE